jgi:DNA polymerase-3 subunit epsilon
MSVYKRTKRAVGDVEIRKAFFSVVDVETTGLNSKKDEIIALAIIPMKGLEIDLGNAYYSLIRPRILKAEGIAIHGLGPGSLKGARKLEEVAKEALHLLSDRILVGHSINFDYKFLERSFDSIGVEFKNKERIDIALLELVIRKLMSEVASLDDLSLESLAKKYGIKIIYRHNALADAFFAAYVFQRQLLRLLRIGINTTGELLRIYKRVSGDEAKFSFL